LKDDNPLGAVADGGFWHLPQPGASVPVRPGDFRGIVPA
jgi:hypothetical protein